MESKESNALYERARRVLPGASSNLGPRLFPDRYAASGDGARVTDVDGNTYVDFIHNWTANIHGLGHPEIVREVASAMRAGTPISMPSEAEIDLAELLCERIPSIEAIKFNNSGSAAGMMAAKAARAFTGKTKLAKLEGTFHGTYDFLEPSSFKSMPGNWGEERAPTPVPLQSCTPKSVLNETLILPADIDAAAELIIRHADELAAVFLDLNPWRWGAEPLSKSFVDSVRLITREQNIALVYDEVMSLRLAPGGAQASYPLPDLTMLGKVIGGGFPIGAVGGRRDIMSMFEQEVFVFGTFTANPVTMAAGRAAMRLLTQEAIARINDLGARAREGLKRALASSGRPGQVTGTGSFFFTHLHSRPLTGFRSVWQGVRLEEFDDLHAHMTRSGFLMLRPGCAGAISCEMTEGDIDSMVAAFTEWVKRS